MCTILCLQVEDEIGADTWRGLARAAGRGRLNVIYTGRKPMMRGKRKDLKAVWGVSESWSVDCEFLDKEESGAARCWQRMKEIMAMEPRRWEEECDRRLEDYMEEE